jgi:antitoxin component YwqK of YwqJK toxin-antitoxin module
MKIVFLSVLISFNLFCQTIELNLSQSSQFLSFDSLSGFYDFRYDVQLEDGYYQLRDTTENHLLFNGAYSGNVKIGLWNWYKNGNLRRQYIYPTNDTIHNNQIVEIEYDSKNQIQSIYTKTFKGSSILLFNDNSITSFNELCGNSLENKSYHFEFDSLNLIKNEWMCDKNNYHGFRQEHRSDGSLEFIGNYNYGSKQGVWNYFDEKNNFFCSEEYKNDSIVKIQFSSDSMFNVTESIINIDIIDSLSNTKIVGQIVDYKKQGNWIYYDKNNNIIRKVFYIDGKIGFVSSNNCTLPFLQ